jgi:hypothetical protein
VRALKIVAALVVAALMVLLALGGLSYAASESGEVVVLTTAGGDGGELQQTRIWVVDLEGRQWLRSGSPDSAWLARLRLNPVVTVERSGASAQYTAAATPAMQEAVNEAMAAKYGWADKVIGMMFGREDAVPVELIPRS